LRGGRGCVTVLFNSPRLQLGDCGGAPPSRALAQHFPASPTIWAKAPVVYGDHRIHRLKPGTIQNSDTRTAPATASYLAVTGANGDCANHLPPASSQGGGGVVLAGMAVSASTNKGACPLAECPLAKRGNRGKAAHPVRDGSSVENPYAAPLASRTGCNINGRRLFLPNSHSSRNGGTTARHCERSAAIAQTTDRRSAPATASCLAVTGAIQTNNSYHAHSLSPFHGGGWGEA
jgi:hypothetical protein